MRNLILFLFVVLLGINGLLLWQNRDDRKEASNTCCEVSGKIDIRLKDVKTSLLPGVLGLVQ